MSWDAGVTITIISVMVLVLARELIAPALALLAADIALLVAGVIGPEEALSGFSNPAPFTVAALFILARAVEKTGALEPLITAAFGRQPGGRRALLRLLAPVAGASGFLNNTAIVAMMAPIVVDWAEKRGRPPSAYLMPLSFATILGGTLTLVGSSTNLVVAGLMVEAGMAPLGMFEITRVGLPVTLLGLLSIALLAPVVLPDRRGARRRFAEEFREFIFTATVEPRGALDGLTVEEAGLRQLQGVFLVEIRRAGQIIAPAAPTTVLRSADQLTFAGRVDMARDIQNMRGLVSTEHKHALDLDGTEHTFFEAVVSPASMLVGKTPKEVQFRSRFQAAIMAIHRAGERVEAKLGDVTLKGGDTLLLLADRDFASRWRDRNDFLLVSLLGGAPPAGSRKAIIVGAVVLGLVLTVGLGILSILEATLLAAFTLIIARVVSPSEARSAINFDVLILIASAFGIGAAMERSGLAAMIGTTIVRGFQDWGAVGVLFALTIATIAITEFISNNATAVLVFPIGLAAAAELGIDPRPFAVAIGVTASMSFLTPIGYQTNTMIYGPGGYRFGDYARLGVPLTIIAVAAITVLVPIFWPFITRGQGQG